MKIKKAPNWGIGSSALEGFWGDYSAGLTSTCERLGLVNLGGISS